MGERHRIEAELIQRELARRSFPHFCEYVYGWPAFHADGTPVVPIHHEWDAHLRRSWAARLAAGIVAPRWHGKTQQLARARPTFDLGQSTEPDLAWCPNIAIKLFQGVGEKAEQTLAQIKSDIEHSERLHQLFPRLEPDYKRGWRGTGFYIKRTANVRDPSFEAHGITSSLTSGRADEIILDDICTLQNSVQEPASRRKVLQALTSDVFNLGGDHTRITNIGTAWHEDDANAHLQEDPEFSSSWSWLVYRIQENPGDPFTIFWPDVWHEEALLRRKRLIGPREFERGFNNRAYAEGEKVFSWAAIKACMDDSVAPGDIPVALSAGGYDLAVSMKDDASRFVGFALGLTPQKQYTPLEIVRAQVSVPTQADTAVRFQERWKPAMHRVENNAYQQALVDILKERGVKGMVVEGFTTGKQKMDPMIGVPSLAPSFEAKQWIIPTKGGHDGENLGCRCAQCVWLRELKNFPAGLTDTVMACWFAFDWLRMHTAPPTQPQVTGTRQFSRARMPREDWQ